MQRKLQRMLGGLLVAEGGSWFYLASGAALFAASVQLFRRRRSGAWLIALTFVATWIWALAEVGLDKWALLPRVNFITIVMTLLSLPWIASRLGQRKPRMPAASFAITALLVAGVVGTMAAMQPLVDKREVALASPDASMTGGEDWAHIGQDVGAARFSTLTQIGPDNVSRLKQVWTYRDAKPANAPASMDLRDESIPIQVDGNLYFCTVDDVVIALDAEDGRLLWRHDPDVDLTGIPTALCRGVTYFDTGDPAEDTCARRILLATLDARLIALDAASGEPCADFGTAGEVSLKDGIGPFEPGEYFQNSPPLVLDGKAVIGGAVRDGIPPGGPSGVIRAFDARTGELAWAWDLGRPDDRGAPPERETYTRGTPNVWTLLSADPELGLVYVPTGNSTPDFVGSYRDALWEEYSSSLVALDIATGEVRWSYQMIHHDLWDYDTAAQPVLFDMPTAQGPVPAVVQATKTGHLFVFDRRTGTPLIEIEEQAFPKSDITDEWTAPTQPIPVGMPSVAGPQLTEADMWGLTPFDQMLCRINFHQFRYEGPFTPPSLEGTIFYPSMMGGVNWGSVSVDKQRGLLIVPAIRLATIISLVPRTEDSPDSDFVQPQRGTKFGMTGGPFMTMLGIPCHRPPYATLTAIDLATREVAWERPLGTAEKVGPMGIASHLPLTIGAPPIVGGPLSTASGLTFIGAVGDDRLHAIETETGRELWSEMLPVGNQSSPITYKSPRSGRQLIVFVSGAKAHMSGGKNEDLQVVAYALD